MFFLNPELLNAPCPMEPVLHARFAAQIVVWNLHVAVNWPQLGNGQMLVFFEHPPWLVLVVIQERKAAANQRFFARSTGMLATVY